MSLPFLWVMKTHCRIFYPSVYRTMLPVSLEKIFDLVSVGVENQR